MSSTISRRFPAGRTDLICRFHADCSGATATEYILILALVVLPIGLMSPLFLNMIRVYGTRILTPMGLPFP